jgi:hypothetical protein
MKMSVPMLTKPPSANIYRSKPRSFNHHDLSCSSLDSSGDVFFLVQPANKYLAIYAIQRIFKACISRDTDFIKMKETTVLEKVNASR